VFKKRYKNVESSINNSKKKYPKILSYFRRLSSYFPAETLVHSKKKCHVP